MVPSYKKTVAFQPFIADGETNGVAPTQSADLSLFQTANMPQKAPELPTTDWSSVAGAGIGAAGQAVGQIAQIAGQKAAMDQAAAQNSSSRLLSEKLAKMQLAANQEQFAREQGMRALIWALNANKGQIENTASARDLRRRGIESMDQLLARVMLKRG